MSMRLYLDLAIFETDKEQMAKTAVESFIHHIENSFLDIVSDKVCLSKLEVILEFEENLGHILDLGLTVSVPDDTIILNLQFEILSAFREYQDLWRAPKDKEIEWVKNTISIMINADMIHDKKKALAFIRSQIYQHIISDEVKYLHSSSSVTSPQQFSDDSDLIYCDINYLYSKGE